MNYKLPIIEKYLQKNYPKLVNRVDFSKKRVYLGSSPDLPEEERTIIVDVIEITLNNSKDEYTKPELTRIKIDISKEISENFDLKIYDYASKYDIKFFVLLRMPWDSWSR